MFLSNSKSAFIFLLWLTYGEKNTISKLMSFSEDLTSSQTVGWNAFYISFIAFPYGVLPYEKLPILKMKLSKMGSWSRLITNHRNWHDIATRVGNLTWEFQAITITPQESTTDLAIFRTLWIKNFRLAKVETYKKCIYKGEQLKFENGKMSRFAPVRFKTGKMPTESLSSMLSYRQPVVSSALSTLC